MRKGLILTGAILMILGFFIGGLFGLVLFAVGGALAIYGLSSKKPQPLAAQPAQGQLRFRPSPSYRTGGWPSPIPRLQQPPGPQAPVNPAPAYQPPPVNPPVSQAPQPTPATGAQFTKSFCTKCGAPLPPGAGFCGACGAKIG